MIDKKDRIIGGQWRDSKGRIWLNNNGRWSYEGIKEVQLYPPPDLVERIS
jgi:hypothetical protein